MAAGLGQRNARIGEPSFGLCIALCVAALATGCATGGRDSASESTMVGRWSIVSKGCAEQYEFRADGTFSSASRNERLDGRYSAQEIAGRPASAKVTRSIEKDNLGMDCAGSSQNDTGRQDVRFIVLDTSKNRMQVCGTDAATGCYGPLIRQVSPAVSASVSSPIDVAGGTVLRTTPAHLEQVSAYCQNANRGRCERVRPSPFHVDGRESIEGHGCFRRPAAA